MRNLINKYAYYIVGGILVLAILVYSLTSNSNSDIQPRVTKAFYIDEETGNEAVFPINKYPPFAGPDGKGTFVMAHKFTTDGGQTSFIAYLTKYTDEAAEALRELPDQGGGDMRRFHLENGAMIRLPGDGEEWVLMKSPEAAALREAALQVPDGGKLEAVLPK